MFTIPGVAKRLLVSVGTVRNLIRAGAIPTVRVGVQIRIQENALEAFIASGGSHQDKVSPSRSRCSSRPRKEKVNV
jgi:excisionase family DNA binding protein